MLVSYILVLLGCELQLQKAVLLMLIFLCLLISLMLCYLNEGTVDGVNADNGHEESHSKRETEKKVGSFLIYRLILID